MSDRPGQTPILVWVESEHLLDRYPHIHNSVDYAWRRALEDAVKEAKRSSAEAQIETRPLIVDDEWITDEGELCRCERIYGDKILMSFVPAAGRRRTYERHLTEFAVGQKRWDGSIIGAPEVES